MLVAPLKHARKARRKVEWELPDNIRKFDEDFYDLLTCILTKRVGERFSIFECRLHPFYEAHCTVSVMHKSDPKKRDSTEAQPGSCVMEGDDEQLPALFPLGRRSRLSFNVVKAKESKRAGTKSDDTAAGGARNFGSGYRNFEQRKEEEKTRAESDGLDEADYSTMHAASRQHGLILRSDPYT